MTPTSFQLSQTCTRCKLCESRTHIVWGQGPLDARVMIIGEGPGEKEDRNGIPFVQWARGGKELLKVCDQNGLYRPDIFVTNLVKCRPPNNRDPKPAEIESCNEWLLAELATVSPELVITAGAYSTSYMLGTKADMETVHGIPFHVTHSGLNQQFWVIPVYHPAAALRSPDILLKFQADFRTVGAWLRGKIQKHHIIDPFEHAETYNVIWDPEKLDLILSGAHECAIDVEWLEDYTPYMIQVSTSPGSGYVVYFCDEKVLSVLRKHLKRSDMITWIHNMASDLPILESDDLAPANPIDTMVMAYLLQAEPQGLKPLAFRHFGMRMQDYQDVLSEAAWDKAITYLQQVASMTWPDPEPLLIIKPDGTPKLKKPSNMLKRVNNILKDVITKDANPKERWKKIKLEEGREDVEDLLGPMPQGDLSDVPAEKAIYYAARDPDATIRVAGPLWERIQDLGLETALATDVAALPMVTDMMTVGIRPDLNHFAKLSEKFDAKMDVLQVQINNMAGRAVRIGSHQDVARLFFDELHLFKVKKDSTNAKVLARLQHEHPIVPLVKAWREVQKLKNTYADKLPKLVGKDGRVHTTIRVTRASTGRVTTTRPNLQAQPTRSEDGRDIRNGFIADPGHVFLSNDYSGIEMRMTAHMSQDPLLLKIFREGGDLHSITASNIFGVPLDQVDDLKHRYPAKRLGFGILYGVSALGLREQLLMAGLSSDEWTVDRCQELIDSWFDVYSGVKAMMDAIHEQARQKGYVQDMWGRVRFVANVHAADDAMQEEGIRQAGNAPIQMGAQGVIKKAMGELNPQIRDLRRSGSWIWPLIQIHDDLLFELEESAVPLAAPIIKHYMENTIRLHVPVEVDQKIARPGEDGIARWGTMIKYKGEPA